MSFMNAKEARPVDDPKALVPFGWAPGGYHCAACSTCGDAHSGSDKRSMRCQDCAEALRDKRADEPTPTTREPADHAELARIAEQCRLKADKLGCDEWRAPALLKQASRGLEALLSEIAALRGEVAERDVRLTKATEDMANIGALYAGAAFKLGQAERQRDEALDTIASTVAKADWMQGHLSGERSSIDRETIELVVSECRALPLPSAPNQAKEAGE